MGNRNIVYNAYEYTRTPIGSESCSTIATPPHPRLAAPVIPAAPGLWYTVRTSMQHDTSGQSVALCVWYPCETIIIIVFGNTDLWKCTRHLIPSSLAVELSGLGGGYAKGGASGWHPRIFLGHARSCSTCESCLQRRRVEIGCDNIDGQKT